MAAGQYFQNFGTRESMEMFLMVWGKERTFYSHSFLPACSLSYSSLSTIKESLKTCDKRGSIIY